MQLTRAAFVAAWNRGNNAEAGKIADSAMEQAPAIVKAAHRDPLAEVQRQLDEDPMSVNAVDEVTGRSQKMPAMDVLGGGDDGMRSAPSVKDVEVSAAPEPSDVLWENLELDEAHETKWERIGFCVITLLIVFGAGATITLGDFTRPETE